MNLTGTKKRAFIQGTKTDVYPSNGGTPYTWVAAATGLYRFVLWSGGASVNNGNGYGGASGAFILVERRIIIGAAAQVQVANPGGASTITLPDGTVLTCGATALNVGGVPSISGVQLPGDILLNGSPGATVFNTNGPTGNGDSGGVGGATSANSMGGAGAPGASGYRGGKGSDTNQYNAGHGGGGSMNSATGGVGGSGLAIIELLRG